jgi:uncharacterized protein YlbG (UPF0298 family)
MQSLSLLLKELFDLRRESFYGGLVTFEERGDHCVVYFVCEDVLVIVEKCKQYNFEKGIDGSM